MPWVPPRFWKATPRPKKRFRGAGVAGGVRGIPPRKSDALSRAGRLTVTVFGSESGAARVSAARSAANTASIIAQRQCPAPAGIAAIFSRRLLVTQRVNRIESGGLLRGIQAEENADRRAEEEGRENPD